MKIASSLPPEKKIAWILLAAMFVYLLVILFLSNGTFDYGDGLSHYFISRYSWKYPHLFLDDWGKPLFTLISSPFSQFGLKGITLFNIICGLAASWVACLIARKLEIPLSYFAVIFTCSAPIYFSVMNSGLTEPLFSLMLIWCIWLCMNERYNLSAVIFSFLPFVRAECGFVLPLFLIYYIIKKKYYTLLLLPVGTVFYSIAGAFYYKNIFWLISHNPYSSANSGSYADAGKGVLWTYIKDYHNITGVALAVLLLLGMIWIAGGNYFYRKPQENKAPKRLEEILLIYGCAFAIFIGHSLVWGLGIFPTLGLDRYMSTPIPLDSIIALRGLQLITAIPLMKKKNWVGNIAGVLFSVYILYSPYTLWYKVPFTRGQTEEVAAKAVSWLKKSKYANNKVYYMDPYMTVCLNVDPYDFKARGELWQLSHVHPGKDMKQGDILMWDAHFGAEEGQMKLTDLLNDTHLKQLNVFKPDVPFKVIGNRDYAVYIFVADSMNMRGI